MKKNICISYKGGTGGFFIYYYILGSDSNLVSKISSIKLGKHKKMVDQVFYQQYRKSSDLKDWKITERWPAFEKLAGNERQVFLSCDYIPAQFDTSDLVVINPYISDKRKWLRMQVEKRCWHFYEFPKNSNFKEFFNEYKEIYKKPENPKIDNADYSFDFLRFLQDKNERKNLCDFLKIDITPRMENYLQYYIECHGDLFNKLIK